ncbi:MAG: site-2 protease family protein [Novosphingobium sp.]|nr:site-2 protease family protein [Novosphingobium sp.]
MNTTLIQAAALIVPLIIAIVFHEVAHGLVARALGDTTAQDARRLTLNPLRHVDPVGTVILPGMLALAHAPVFGWAKPVPVNQWRLRNPRFGMMAVAAAGPATNLLLGAAGAAVLGLLLRVHPAADRGIGVAGFIGLNLINFIAINVFLALFNLLPIPPFDGSHIVEGVLPPRLARGYARLRRFGFALVFLLLIVLPMFVPGFSVIARWVEPPVEWLFGHYLRLAAAIAGFPVSS